MSDRPTAKLVKALAGMTSEKLGEFSARLDGWTNNLTGFGTARDKTTYGRFCGRQPLDLETISDLYHHNDMAARMVDVVPQEMFREGFKVTVDDPKLTEALNDKLEELDARVAFMDARTWGRCYGGSAIIIGADDSRSADRELDPSRAKDIGWLHVVDRRYLQVNSHYRTEGHPKFGKPETYMVTAGSGFTASTKIVHESRLILFGGEKTGEQEKQMNGGWDYSVLQRPHDILRQFDSGWTAVENLLVDGHQTIYKMSGLADAIAAGQKDYLQQRAQLADMARSVVKAMVIDAGNPGAQEASEEFLRHSVSFSDIPATLDKFMLRLAASVRMPVTLLMGQSPAGMNATGESDFRWFYDRIRSDQNNDAAPKIKRLCNIWTQTKAGQAFVRGEPLPLNVAFPSLWTETPLAQAQTRLALAQADAAYAAAGVYLPEEIALARSPAEPCEFDVPITDSSRKSRERMIKDDMEKAEAGEDGDEETTPSASPFAAPSFEG